MTKRWGVMAIGAAFAAMVGCQPTTTPAPARAATYEVVATQVLSNCTTRSCHGAEGKKGNLVLTPDQAYDQLVNVPAANAGAAAKGKKRVVPGDADASFLIHKLTGPAADEGNRMPLGGQPMSAEDIDLVRRWIADGAKR